VQKIYNFIRAHRKARFFQLMGKVSERYLWAWSNEDNWDFPRNGERFALQRFAQWWGDRPLLVWDVGAHHGEWATEAHGELPTARIVSFEMIPQTHQGLVKAMGDKHWSVQVDAGLSDQPGIATACFNQKFDTTSALNPRLGDQLYDDKFLVDVECRLIRGDDYAREHGVPNLLKIDTEGHEVAVMRGCREFLSGPNAPEMIQFEYGKTYLPTGSTLKQVYDILAPAGYKIGRLYPDQVGFRDYDWSADDFRMGNCIAVKSPELAALLR
jgi:FkbM family methyltransferase